MKKSSKVILLAAAVVSAAGIGMSIGGVAMGATVTGLNLSKYGFSGVIRQIAKYVSLDNADDRDEIDEVDSTKSTGTGGDIYLIDEVPDLELFIGSGELYLQEYDGNQIKIEVSGKYRDKVRVGQEDDTLVVESTGGVQDRKIILSYPKKTEFEEASIEVPAGTVNLKDNFCAKELDVSVVAGELTNDGAVTAENTTITVGTGNVDLEDLTVQKLEADCGIGNIDFTVNGRESDYDYEISCAAGNVDIGGSSYSGLGHEKDISNPGASGRMELDCGVGNITVDFEE